jgi:hypothetical protein
MSKTSSDDVDDLFDFAAAMGKGTMFRGCSVGSYLPQRNDK